MPPPFLVAYYRGYELVQWFDHGPFDVNHKGAYIVTEHMDRVGVEALVDEWLDAP